VAVTVHYLDDFDQAQMVTRTLTVEVREAPEPTPGAEEGDAEEELGFWRRVLRILRGLVGLGS
jgi:hypothetical protein